MSNIRNKKNVAMIPVRMGSKRVKSKNIRMINGKPLVFYILDSVIKSGCFPLQDIYINSEDIISLSINGSKFDDTNELYIKDKPKLSDAYLKFIPYYLWSNRGENEMLVWINEK